MSPWLIYLWGISDDFRMVAGMSAMLMILCGGMCGAMAYENGSDQVVVFCRRLAITGALFGLLGLLTPNQKTIALMYVLPRVAESEAIQRDVPELYRLAVDALKDQLTDEIGGNDERR